MQQLVLFQMTAEAQSLTIVGKAKLEKQSNLSSNITASNKFFFDMEDSVEPRKFDDEESDYGDIYDEYEDFDVCSLSWC